MEYDKSTKATLSNWTAKVAKRFAEYGAINGLDAWRKFCNKHIILIDDALNISTKQLMNITPVGEYEMDNLLDERIRRREQHIPTGGG